jgi:hypothetical protein
MLYICIFSNNLDLKQTIRVLHTQLIMSFCAVSIVTYNKLSEIMTPFHWGNKIRSRINVTTGKTSFNWLFNTGAAIKCMNADSFREAFGHQKPRRVKKSVGCIAANVIMTIVLPMISCSQEMKYWWLSVLAHVGQNG